MQAALSQKPKFKLHVTLDAPKVAIPIPATPETPDGSAPHTTVLHDCASTMMLLPA